MAATETTDYTPLTEKTAVELAGNLDFFPKGASLSSREIGDGNLNYVFHITDEHGKGLIIKQALPYAKVVGESWPLTLKRAEIEANALKKHGGYVPHLVPEVYATDDVLAYTVMEDLSHLTVARAGLNAGEAYPKLSDDIGEYLAQTLFHTSDFGLHPFDKKRLAAEFSNPELCKITEDLILTDPYFNNETNDFEEALTPDVEAIWNNAALQLEAAKLKQSFLTEAEALLHGDLHTGSIFASKDETKVIDPEFAFYGPIGFDVGLFLANLVFQSIARTEESRDVITDHIRNTWQVFSSRFSELWEQENGGPFKNTPGYKEAVLAKIFRDTVGFAGAELIRRTIGLAHVSDLDGIENDEERVARKRQTLETGQAFILKRTELASIDEVLALIEELR